MKTLTTIFNIYFETVLDRKIFIRQSLIHKAKEKYYEINHSPIYLISNDSQIFHNRFISFLNKYDIINNDQYGFRVTEETKDALANFTKFKSETLDKSKRVIAVFLDLVKACDTIDHNILLQKLNDIRFRENALRIIKNQINVLESHRVRYYVR